MSYDFLLTIAIIMLFTKVFGLTSERVHMPQVVGALIAGVLVGNQCADDLRHVNSFARQTENFRAQQNNCYRQKIIV